jgi:peptidoglycan/xylan/chitin deacetylase (PgdA/CDA1 family)
MVNSIVFCEGGYQVLLSRRGFLKDLGVVGSSMLLSAMGLVSEELAFSGGSDLTSLITKSPPDHPGDVFRSEAEREQKIEFLAGHEIQRGDRFRRSVLMTYDDQGHRVWIDKILDAYQVVGGKASFFFTGDNLSMYVKQIRRIVAEGHVFGSHGLVHEPHTAMRSDEIRDQIREWLRLVENIIPGYEVRFFRFPYGDRNERVRRVIAEFGLQSVHWNVESGGLDQDTFRKVVENVFNGSIVLSHMTRYYDVYEAERILKQLRDHGYSLETVEVGMELKDVYPPGTRSVRSYFPETLQKRLEP